MRNLKRALSLALAAVMVLGLMIVGAGAVGVDDFTDADEITNREAVSVLTSLGVITGKDDGSYDPSGTITRAEMTTIICRILNGGTDPQLSSTVVNTFSDTVNHWAAGYIEFCVASGIVAGRGDGTFDPNGTVTVAEGAKMMLVALGYDADVEGLVGSSWQINTNVLANQKGLYSGMEMASTSENLTRDNAAQMGYNLLDLNTITYSYIIGTDGGTVTTKPQANDKNDTVLEEYFNAVRVEGVVTGNEMAVLTASSKGGHLDADRTRIAVTNYGDGDGEQNAFNGTLTIVAPTGLEELGRTVDVFVKASSSSSRATIIGSVIVTEDNTVVTDYSGDTIAKVADNNNLNLVTGETQTALNYGQLADYTASVAGNGTRGVEKILIDNDGDSDLDYVLLNTYSFGKVTSYVTSGDGSIVVSTKPQDLTASDKNDVVGFDDVAKDDYVIAAQIGGRIHVAKAETVTGSLDSYRTTAVDGSTYTTKLEVGGTNYDVSWIDGYTQGTDNIQAAKTYGSDTTLDVEATFYLGKGGYVSAVGDAKENAYNYALVLAKGSDINDQVKVVLSDGTIGTYTLSSSGEALGAVNKGEVYSYTLNGNTIKLTKVSTNNPDYVDNGSGKTATFTKGKTTVSTGNASEAASYATANTVFFYVDGTKGSTIGNNDVDVYTGYNAAPTLLSGKATADIYRNSATRAVAVVFWGTGITTGNVEDLIYLTSTGNKNSDRMLADAYIAGSADLSKNVEIALSGQTAKETPYVYTVNADGYYELSPVDSGNYKKDVTVVSASSNTFVFNDGSKDYEVKITSDTLLIDNSEYLDNATAELGAGPDVNDKLAYVVYSKDGSNPDEAKMIVIKNPKVDNGGQNPSEPSNGFDGTNTATVDLSTGKVVVNYYGSMNAAALKSAVQRSNPSLKTVSVSGSTTADLALTVDDGTGSVTIPNSDITFNEYVKVTAGSDVTVTYDEGNDGTFEGTINAGNSAYVKVGANVQYKTGTADAVIEATSATQTTDSSAKPGTKAGGVSGTALSTGKDLYALAAAKIADQTTANLTFGTTAACDNITEGTTYVVVGTKVFVKAETADKALSSATLTLTVETAPGSGVIAISSFTMPAADVAATAITQAA